MPTGFRWLLGDWVGGQTAVHEAFKPYLAVKTQGAALQRAGEILIQPRDTTDLVISGLGFTPTAVMFVCFRPRDANGGSDAAFGARGGGMSWGAAGHAVAAEEWDAGTSYTTGDYVLHEGVTYVNVDVTPPTIGDEPPSANWDALDFAQFAGSTRIRHAFEQPQKMWSESSCLIVAHDFAGVSVLTLSLASFDADGFTLNQDVNLYDQTDYVAWLAVGAPTQVGTFAAGTTEIPTGLPMTGACFISNKLLGETHQVEYWDHMCGFAASNGNAVLWGGRQPTGWDWTTERWEDDQAILFCTPAAGSSFAGTSVNQMASAFFDTDSVDLTWSVFDNQAWRIGYVLFEEAYQGVVSTSWETRPNGAFTDDEGANFEPTAMRPDLVIMTGTNYTFDWSDVDPYDSPRSPGAFQFGGSGGLGWHVAPYSISGNDAWGVHTYGNSVAERGHYSNSGTQFSRRYIMAGQGANSNPPAYHQHSVNIIPNPVIVGTNYRYAERHAHVKRIHINPSDVYTPTP